MMHVLVMLAEKKKELMFHNIFASLNKEYSTLQVVALPMSLSFKICFKMFYSFICKTEWSRGSDKEGETEALKDAKGKGEREF